MKNKRKSNSKIIISLLIFIMLSLSAIATVVTVMALNQHTVNSSISIQYVAIGVSADVSCWYQLENGSKQQLTTANNKSVIEIRNGDEVKDSFQIESLNLDGTNSYVTICYEFKNVGETRFAGEQIYIPDADNPSTNMEMKYSMNGTNYDSLNAGFSIDPD